MKNSLSFTKQNAVKTPKSLLKKAGWGDGKSMDTEIALQIVPKRFPDSWNNADNAGKRKLLRRYKNYMNSAFNKSVASGNEN